MAELLPFLPPSSWCASVNLHAWMVSEVREIAKSQATEGGEQLRAFPDVREDIRS